MTSKELKRIREKLGLTHGELAKHLKVGRTTVLLWEHGRMPKYPPTQDHLERVLHELVLHELEKRRLLMYSKDKDV